MRFQSLVFGALCTVTIAEDIVVKHASRLPATLPLLSRAAIKNQFFEGGWVTQLKDGSVLSAIINIHDVLLAQMFAERIVGLQLGEIVYDGPPDGLSPEVLTQIYGEEDWEATIRKVDDDDEEGAAGEGAAPEGHHGRSLDRDRLAGAT